MLDYLGNAHKTESLRTGSFASFTLPWISDASKKRAWDPPSSRRSNSGVGLLNYLTHFLSTSTRPYHLFVARSSAYMSMPDEVVGVHTETLAFIHRKEVQRYTRFACVAYRVPPQLVGAVGDIFLAGEEPTTWIRTEYGWRQADKTIENGVPRESHPQFLGYIRLDALDSQWKGRYAFLPKVNQEAKKAAAAQEAGEFVAFARSLTQTKWAERQWKMPPIVWWSCSGGTRRK